MTVDLVVIGLGSAGRSAVELAAELGATVVGVDRRPPGGDCLWTGCVPSKTLLASARTAQAMRTADRFGIAPVEPDVDLDAIWARIRNVQGAIATTDDDPDRLRALGATILLGEARISSPTSVDIDGSRFETRHILVCTGSRPIVPTGLEDALTTDSLWSLPRPPSTLQIVGAGPVGCELGQGLHRLGVDVEVVERASTILPGFEPSIVEPLAEAFAAEGLAIRTGVDDVPSADGARLVAVGRAPVVHGLGLDEVGVETTDSGVVVDDQLRTNVPTIAAAGDVTGRPHLTSRAASDATAAVRSLLLPGRVSRETVIPQVVFTDPEVATVGDTVAAAVAIFGADADVWTLDVPDIDRGRTDDALGRIVLVTGPRQRLLGAHITAPHAGEAIGELALARRDERRLNHLAGLLHAYPTISAGIGTLAARAVRARAAAVGARARRRALRD